MVKYSTIDIAELRRIISALLVHAEKEHGPELKLDHDCYWEIDRAALYDTSQRPEKPDALGSLSDDWEFLFNMRDESIEQVGPYQMLMHAAPLLRDLAEKNGA